MKKAIDCVLWDLDGTLLDTLEDVAGCVNGTLEKYGFPPRELGFIRLLQGDSARRILAVCAGLDENDPKIDGMYPYFCDLYAAKCDVKTRPYPGIIPMLKRLKARGIKMCVVSNKSEEQAAQLVKKHFGDLISCCVGEKKGVPMKPHPAMVREALKRMGTSKENSVYVGDTEVDIQTADNSGLEKFIVGWGFRDEDQLLKAGAKRVIKSALELEKTITEQSEDKKMKTYTVKTFPDAEAAKIDSVNWEGYSYRPDCEARLSLRPGEGFELKLLCRESKPLARFTKFDDPVWTDSCLEFFANFAPANGDIFINLEMNSAGGWLMGVGPHRDGRTTPEAVKKYKFRPKAQVFADRWEVGSFLKLDMLKEIFGDFDPKPGYVFYGNFFKCGEATPMEHYLSWNPIKSPAPDFHRPECFGKFIVG